MTSKQRAFLRSMANGRDAILHVGKTGVTPEVVASVSEALLARELVKINIQENCPVPVGEAAVTVSERTRSEVVQVIGRKVILYKSPPGNRKRQIDLDAVK